MLRTTIPSYLYQQYADDDDLQAFVAAYNSATQAIVDWLNSVSLPYYPGLSGPLLDWVIEGLYGLKRTSLASQATNALGPLNTVPLNTMPLNAYVASSQTFYALTDDLFQRILTWDFYKGDGKRFSIRWLKRRIMRFLLGTNGLDPNPASPGFVIGTENTQAIGVVITGGVLTVTINQVLLARFVQLEPGILTVFKAAFESRALDLPVQFSYVCTIVTLMTAVAAPTVQTLSAALAPVTTAASTVTTFAGSGSYTHAWGWVAGGAGITIDAPTSHVTTFTVPTAAHGLLYAGLAQVTVTDTVTAATATASVSVNVTLGGGSTYVPSALVTETGAALVTETGAVLLT
jgi:hypothetical protein